jgi:hypothetical protein
MGCWLVPRRAARAARAITVFATRSDDEEEDEEGKALDPEKLRQYERERLRFYYAIVECDTAATAASLYQQCDGLVRGDVQPDAWRQACGAVTLLTRPPSLPPRPLSRRNLSAPPRAWTCATCRTSSRSTRDSRATAPPRCAHCQPRAAAAAAAAARAHASRAAPRAAPRRAQVPSEYTPVDYTTQALQQTRVALTWDADDPERRKRLRRKLTHEQLRDEDFAAYLGSGSEEEGAEGEEAQARAGVGVRGVRRARGGAPPVH